MDLYEPSDLGTMNILEKKNLPFDRELYIYCTYIHHFLDESLNFLIFLILNTLLNGEFVLYTLFLNGIL